MAAVLGLLLGGCEAPAPRPEPVPVVRLDSSEWSSGGDVAQILRYAAHLDELSEEELAVELLEARDALPTDPAQGLRMSLVLSAPRASFRSESEAARVLDEFLGGRQGAPGDDLDRLATLMLGLLERTLEERSAHEHTRAALSKETERADRLADQIEALKSIEKNLSTPQTEGGSPVP